MLDVDALLGDFIAETRKAYSSGEWERAVQLYDSLIAAGVDLPLPPGVQIDFKAEDHIRAHGLGVCLQ